MSFFFKLHIKECLVQNRKDFELLAFMECHYRFELSNNNVIYSLIIHCRSECLWMWTLHHWNFIVTIRFIGNQHSFAFIPTIKDCNWDQTLWYSGMQHAKLFRSILAIQNIQTIPMESNHWQEMVFVVCSRWWWANYSKKAFSWWRTMLGHQIS